MPVPGTVRALPPAPGIACEWSFAVEAGLGRRDETGSESADDDAALMAATVGGDVVAFRRIVARHLPAVLSLARRMLRDDAEAEDVAQETLVRLWRQGRAVEIGPGGLRPWLRRVASNLSIDRLRASGRLEVTDEVPEQETPADQLSQLSAKDLSARVAEALAGLPDRQRLALTLFHYEELSQIEVGRMMGISDEAVESLLGRARRTLKKVLADEWQDLLPERSD